MPRSKRMTFRWLAPGSIVSPARWKWCRKCCARRRDISASRVTFGNLPKSAAKPSRLCQTIAMLSSISVTICCSLEQYDELLSLTAKYKDVFPKEPDIPLLAGYVYKQDGRSDQALEEFTEALNRDPNVVTAYVNRGFVFNDLDRPDQAAPDFEQALKREPKDGEAHLGLAFAELNLEHPQAAVRQTQLAEGILGDSEVVHMHSGDSLWPRGPADQGHRGISRRLEIYSHG